jgi:hypothetical protein
MTPVNGPGADEARRQEAQEALDRLRGEGATFAGSALVAAARRATGHFGARDAVGAEADGSTDPIELWGRRIGRALSLIAFIGLSIYLAVTYLR